MALWVGILGSESKRNESTRVRRLELKGLFERIDVNVAHLLPETQNILCSEPVGDSEFL